MDNKNQKFLNKKVGKLKNWQLIIIVVVVIIIILTIILVVIFVPIYDVENVNFVLTHTVFNGTIDPQTGFGKLFLPKQSIFINDLGTKVIFGNPFHINIDEENSSPPTIGAVFIYSQVFEEGIFKEWELIHKFISNSTEQIYFGSSVSSDNNLSKIFVGAGNNSVYYYIKDLSSSELNYLSYQYNFIIEEETKNKYVITTFVSPGINEKDIFCSSIDDESHVSFLKIGKDNKLILKSKFLQKNLIGSSVNGGALENEKIKLLAIGFGNSEDLEGFNNTCANIYKSNKTNDGFILYSLIKSQDTLFDCIAINKINNENNKNYAFITGISFSGNEGNGKIYEIINQNSKELLTISFPIETIPIGDGFETVITSCSINGGGDIFVIGNSTNKVYVYGYSKNKNKIAYIKKYEGIVETINSTFNTGISVAISSNSKTMAFSVYDKTSGSYGLNIFSDFG